MAKEYVICYCENNSDILLVLKNRPAKLAGRLNLPGGKIEPSDTGPIEAALRELQEETGLIGTNPTYMGRLVVENNAIIHCIKLCVDAYRPLEPREEETEIVQWYDWCELITDPRLMPNLRIIIPLVHAGIIGWVIEDNVSSWGKSSHNVSVQVPTYQ